MFNCSKLSKIFRDFDNSFDSNQLSTSNSFHAVKSTDQNLDISKRSEITSEPKISSRVTSSSKKYYDLINFINLSDIIGLQDNYKLKIEIEANYDLKLLQKCLNHCSYYLQTDSKLSNDMKYDNINELIPEWIKEQIYYTYPDSHFIVALSMLYNSLSSDFTVYGEDHYDDYTHSKHHQNIFRTIEMKKQLWQNSLLSVYELFESNMIDQFHVISSIEDMKSIEKPSSGTVSKDVYDNHFFVNGFFFHFDPKDINDTHRHSNDSIGCILHNINPLLIKRFNELMIQYYMINQSNHLQQPSTIDQLKSQIEYNSSQYNDMKKQFISILVVNDDIRLVIDIILEMIMSSNSFKAIQSQSDHNNITMKKYILNLPKIISKKKFLNSIEQNSRILSMACRYQFNHSSLTNDNDENTSILPNTNKTKNDINSNHQPYHQLKLQGYFSPYCQFLTAKLLLLLSQLEINSNDHPQPFSYTYVDPQPYARIRPQGIQKRSSNPPLHLNYAYQQVNDLLLLPTYIRDSKYLLPMSYLSQRNSTYDDLDHDPSQSRRDPNQSMDRPLQYKNPNKIISINIDHHFHIPIVPSYTPSHRRDYDDDMEEISGGGDDIDQLINHYDWLTAVRQEHSQGIITEKDPSLHTPRQYFCIRFHDGYESISPYRYAQHAAYQALCTPFNDDDDGLRSIDSISHTVQIPIKILKSNANVSDDFDSTYPLNNKRKRLSVNYEHYSKQIEPNRSVREIRYRDTYNNEKFHRHNDGNQRYDRCSIVFDHHLHASLEHSSLFFSMNPNFSFR